MYLKLDIVQIQFCLAEIAKLRKENAEISELREKLLKFTEIEAENAKLRQIIEKNAKYNVENAKLKTEVARLRYDIKEMKQQTQVITEVKYAYSIEDTFPMEVIPKISTASIPSNQCNKVNSSPSSVSGQKSLKDREIDAFLELEYKRKVSDEIKQHNKEKKLLCESVNQNVTSSLSCDIEIITSDRQQKNIPKISQENPDIIIPPIILVSVLDESDTISEILKLKNQIVKGLVQELTSEFSFASGNKSLNESKVNIFEISKPCIQDMIPDSTQSLLELFDKAIKLDQKQILCWFYYSLEFENKVRNLTADGKTKDKTARLKIYKKMKLFLPNITNVNLRKKTERARKILKLFDEGGVGIDRIKYITYSASTISELKDAQIQYIINQTNAFILLKAEVSISTNVLSGFHSNSTYDRTYFCNKILNQYSNLYREFSSENFDYYGITEETSCLLCKLKHDNEESIEEKVNMTKSDKILTFKYLDWHTQLTGLPSILTDKICFNLYKKYKRETGHEP
ncbi:hypothetical protein GLOIN_2v1869616 [Rhizophagus clarus]|uniref:Uncharacterized protein n=1 Tax=Rhizophagus clarus TaxID=94130 RepID=A0A8H3M8L3_9GLOM|nr:hypothetical protein GLOIN_2v1869616 [Rhizophagus clarus]